MGSHTFPGTSPISSPISQRVFFDCADMCRYVQIATARFYQPMIPRPKIQHVWPPDRRSRRGLRKRRGCKTCLPGGDENTSGFEPLWSLNFIDLVSMIKVSTLSQHAPQEDSNELFEFTSRMHRRQALLYHCREVFFGWIITVPKKTWRVSSDRDCWKSWDHLGLNFRGISGFHEDLGPFFEKSKQQDIPRYSENKSPELSKKGNIGNIGNSFTSVMSTGNCQLQIQHVTKLDKIVPESNRPY